MTILVRGWTMSHCSNLRDQDQSNHWCDTTFSRLTLVIGESTGPVLNERADYNYVFLTFVEPVWKMSEPQSRIRILICRHGHQVHRPELPRTRPRPLGCCRLRNRAMSRCNCAAAPSSRIRQLAEDVDPSRITRCVSGHRSLRNLKVDPVRAAFQAPE
jgi:hypothetical protein